MGITTIKLKRGTTNRFTSGYSDIQEITSPTFSNPVHNGGECEPWFNKTSGQLWVDNICINPRIYAGNGLNASKSYTANGGKVYRKLDVKIKGGTANWLNVDGTGLYVYPVLSTAEGNILSVDSEGKLFAQASITLDDVPAYTGGTYISVSGTTISHKTPAQASVSTMNPSAHTPTLNWGGTFTTTIPTVDSYGHIKSYLSYTYTLPAKPTFEDLYVMSGEIVENSEEDEFGTGAAGAKFLKLVIGQDQSTIFIDVNDLVDGPLKYYNVFAKTGEAGSSADLQTGGEEGAKVKLVKGLTEDPSSGDTEVGTVNIAHVQQSGGIGSMIKFKTEDTKIDMHITIIDGGTF